MRALLEVPGRVGKRNGKALSMAPSKPEKQKHGQQKAEYEREGGDWTHALGLMVASGCEHRRRIGYEHSSIYFGVPNELRHALLRSLAGGVHHAVVPPTWLVPVLYARIVNDGSD